MVVKEISLLQKLILIEKIQYCALGNLLILFTFAQTCNIS